MILIFLFFTISVFGLTLDQKLANSFLRTKRSNRGSWFFEELKEGINYLKYFTQKVHFGKKYNRQKSKFGINIGQIFDRN